MNQDTRDELCMLGEFTLCALWLVALLIAAVVAVIAMIASVPWL